MIPGIMNSLAFGSSVVERAVRREASCATPWADRDQPGGSRYLHDSEYTLRRLDNAEQDLVLNCIILIVFKMCALPCHPGALRITTTTTF